MILPGPSWTALDSITFKKAGFLLHKAKAKRTYTLMRQENRKKMILSLRWTIIIATCYLMLFGKGERASFHYGHVIPLLYVLSNTVLTFFPSAWFSNLKLFYFLALFDTGVVSLSMYLSDNVNTDFYLIFFLIIIFASVSRSYRLLLFISAASSLSYGAFLYLSGLFTSEDAVSYTLRIPFIFITALFYGYLVQTFSQEKQMQVAVCENKYQSLFENAKEGIFILRDPQLEITDANREAERLMGCPKGELLGKSFLDLAGTKDRAAEFLKEMAKEKEGRSNSLSLLRKGGTWFEVALSIKGIDLGEGPFYQMIFRDLTDQRQLEKKIRESKRHLQSIFDGIRDQLSIQDPGYQILRVNKAVVDRYHVTFKDLIGRKCYEAYHRRSLPCEGCPLKDTFETRQPSSSILRPAGGDVTFRIFSYPLLDEKGEILSAIEYIQDISKEQRLQEQLIQSEKLAGIGLLASGVAHEINNPLSGIMGMAELALEEDDRSTAQAYIKDILSCSHRISEIVGGLRSYSRTARDTERSLVDLNGVLENSLKMVRLALKEASVKVVTKFEPVERIEANEGELQQIFVNLITNAFQAMNGNDRRLTLSTRPLDGSVEVRVSDNGAGIPPQHQKKIFDPFFTTKKPGEGTGLGLNIVYRIVTKCQGTIDVESKEGLGTTFILRFPTGRKL
jgi:PAS domain S-box-containing protein